MRGTVLVVEDRSGGTALATVRGLGRAGWRVALAAPGGRSYAARSRWCSSVHDARPAADVGGHVRDVARACAAAGADVVVPCGDAELLAVSAGRDEIPAAVAAPAHEAVLRAHDRLSLNAAMHAVGLAVPRTSADRPAALVPPLVVKPRSRLGDPGPGRVEARVVSTPDDADRRAAELRARGIEPIFQEHVDGVLTAVVLLLDRDGRVVARLQQEASRTYPVPIGNAVRARTVPVDDALAGPITQALRSLGWWGLAQVELLRPADGAPRVIDLNARVYGSIGLALAAGVNFPDLLARLVAGEAVDRVADAPAGVTYQSREQDLRRALQERTPSLARDVLDTLHGRYDGSALWSADDPRPVLAFGATLAGRWLHRVRG